MSEPRPGWLRRVRGACGSDLRRVVHRHEGGRDVRFVREDVDPGDPADASGPLDAGPRDRSAELLCVARRFEDAVELHLPVSGTESVEVTLDGISLTEYDDLVPYLRRVIERGAASETA